MSILKFTFQILILSIVLSNRSLLNLRSVLGLFDLDLKASYQQIRMLENKVKQLRGIIIRGTKDL